MKQQIKTNAQRLKVFTWHVHGSYQYYLSQAKHIDFYLPYSENREHGYGGKVGPFPWGENVHEIPVQEVRNYDFDVILFQDKNHYLKDQFEIFSEEQQTLPKIFLEHDPPRETPTDTKHVIDDKHMLLVHVTDFNDLMWDNNKTPSIVIDHGATVPKDATYKGTENKGVVLINNIHKRGRRLGYDIFEEVRKDIPLDIIGMGSKDIGGLGEVPHRDLPYVLSNYSFFFNPIRYTSLGLSVIEAMMVGLPIVGLATTEMVTVIKNDVNGYLATDIEIIKEKMNMLLSNRNKAYNLGIQAKIVADGRFSISRFAREWETVFEEMAKRKRNRKRIEIGGSI